MQKFILRKNTWIFRTVCLRAELQTFYKFFHLFQISVQPCPLCFSISVKPVLWKFMCFSCAQEKRGSFCSPGKQSAVLLGRAAPHTRKLASETHPDGVVFSRTWGEGLGVGSRIHWTSASVRLKDSNKRSRSTELAG